MKTFIGAENIISSLGINAEENFNSIKKNKSGIKQFKKIGFGNEDL